MGSLGNRTQRTMSDIYDPATTDPRETIAPLLKRVMMEIFAAVDNAFGLDKELAPFEVTAAQFGILVKLHHQEIDCAVGLCKELNYDRGAMSRMLDRLESKGLIRRVRRDGERRLIAIEITPRGERLFPKMQACVVTTINHFLRGIAPADVHRAEAVLRRMLENAS
jgi:MarR family multiple antibiotic resistance transcriptional regulator